MSLLLLPLLAALARAGEAPPPLPSPPAAPAPASLADGAVIVGLSGQAWVSVAGGAPVPLDRCTVVPVGATVCTGPDAWATVRLAPTPDTPGADDVVLLPGTCLDVEQATADQAQVAVRQGGVTVAAARDGVGHLRVRTRDGVALGARGGFRVTLEEIATRTEAVTGAVTLEGDAGRVEVPAGTGSRVSAGQAPSAPVALLLPEALLAPEEGAALRRPDFSWQPVPAGTGYRVELSADPWFTDIVEAIDVAEPAWRPDFLFVPTAIEGLWWRVSVYDRLGFQGVPTDARFLRLPPGVRQ